ncbi:hypothetical protein [Anabaena sp. CCY 9402-a]|uniref:hypothetical protein n=1 Tax=Anabaena sp. CCY 9402-a TaxID=3103867 RepID=UPI0039C7060C
MKILYSNFLILSIFGLNFAISPPAKAAISCENDTIIRYSNGSLYTCIINQNTTLQLSSASGISTFPCKAESYIYFDKKGQFQRCQLAENIQIIIGDSLEKCPANFWINVSISDAGHQSITCRQY